MSMDNILSVVFSSDGDEEIKVSFKKTVNIKPYETEVLESEALIKIPNGTSGIERMLYLSIAQAQLQYEIYMMLALKGYVTQDELERERDSIVKAVNLIIQKANDLGKSINLGGF